MMNKTKKPLGKKVENEQDFIQNKYYTTATSDNSWQLMFWDNENVTMWSNNNSTITRKFKRKNFIKNWFFAN